MHDIVMYHTNHTNTQYMNGNELYRAHPTDYEKSLKNFWELNMKCFQEMYLDKTSTQIQHLPSSFSTTSTGANSLTPSTMSPILRAADATVMQHPHLSAVGASVSAAAANGNTFQAATGSNIQHLLQQQQLAAVAVAQHQLALTAARSNIQPQDEISKSLKMFAMLTAYKTGAEPTPNLQAPVDDVMQDFACNGHICDELNRYHQYQAALQFANSGINNSAALNVNSGALNVNSGALNISAGNNIINNTAPSTQHFNVNINDVRSNLWKMLPSHMQQSHAAAAAATNIDYNSNKKPQHKQRVNLSKLEKYSSIKHCVFCENNNEPEAVVKSHAVRDSFGRVLCPKLRTYVCPICNASGDMAHTIKYCPQKPIITMEDAIKAESFRLAKGTFYKQQMKI